MSGLNRRECDLKYTLEKTKCVLIENKLTPEYYHCKSLALHDYLTCLGKKPN